MPLYAYQCPKCLAETSELRKVDERNDGLLCYRCGKADMNLILDAPPMGIVRNPAVPARNFRRK
jgi:putative FmdB family regulatory protein